MIYYVESYYKKGIYICYGLKCEAYILSIKIDLITYTPVLNNCDLR